jgi:hypothetical protein
MPRESKKKSRDPNALLTPLKKELTVFGKVWTAMRTVNQYLIINPGRTKQYKVTFKDLSEYIRDSTPWEGYEDDIELAKDNLHHFRMGLVAWFPGSTLPWRWVVKYITEVLSKEDDGRD